MVQQSFAGTLVTILVSAAPSLLFVVTELLKKGKYAIPLTCRGFAAQELIVKVAIVVSLMYPSAATAS